MHVPCPTSSLAALPDSHHELCHHLAPKASRSYTAITDIFPSSSHLWHALSLHKGELAGGKGKASIYQAASQAEQINCELALQPLQLYLAEIQCKV